MDGLLLIDKPSGWTSFDVVAKIRGILQRELRAQGSEQKKVKVGHCGTLDPMATGLLIIVVGSYCKRASEFSGMSKVYAAEVTLGANSTTDDAEGELTVVSAAHPGFDTVTKVLKSFVGEQLQMPPNFSAKKINGQKAYDLARAGIQPDLKAVNITIHSIDDVTYNYPKLTFTTDVSSGTYIRSIARDLGVNLGTGAYLTALRRLSINNFGVEKAFEPMELTPELIMSNLTKVDSI